MSAKRTWSSPNSWLAATARANGQGRGIRAHHLTPSRTAEVDGAGVDLPPGLRFVVPVRQGDPMVLGLIGERGEGDQGALVSAPVAQPWPQVRRHHD